MKISIIASIILVSSSLAFAGSAVAAATCPANQLIACKTKNCKTYVHLEKEKLTISCAEKFNISKSKTDQGVIFSCPHAADNIYIDEIKVGTIIRYFVGTNPDKGDPAVKLGACENEEVSFECERSKCHVMVQEKNEP